ncbi:hypothetical protein ACVWZV_004515 [Bradyrhizobium sp. GM5.1]
MGEIAMSGVHCFTSVSYSYLNRARVLAETLKRFHPDWTLWLGLSDREPPGFDPHETNILFDRVIRLEELDIPNRSAWTFSHNVVELCTAVKGPMLCHILNSGANKVVYLDPDIAVFSSLEQVTTLLETHSVVLTPHLVAPERTAHGILDNEIGSLKHGVYNLGFISVANTEEGRSCAAWWSARLQKHCFDDIPNGLFTDQRWCDLIPAFFSRTAILRDPGYNAACWNLSNRPITFTPSGDILADGAPLRFFHFTKVDTVGEAVLELYSNGQNEVFELLRWYRGRVAAPHFHKDPKRLVGLRLL